MMIDDKPQPRSGDLFVDNGVQIFYSAGIVKIFPIGISIPALIKGAICATNITPPRGLKKPHYDPPLLRKLPAP
jgi:hypothetical protein